MKRNPKVTAKIRPEIKIEIGTRIETGTKRSIELKKKKEKGNGRKKRRRERKWSMPERRREWKTPATVRTVTIQVKMNFRSTVYSMNQFLMITTQLFSQCTIRLKHEDPV
jgi:hypothetical protein